MQAFTPDDLMELAADPQAAASPLLARRYLLVDAAEAAGADPELADWLRQVPAPVIAFGGPRCPISEACDVHVERPAEAQALSLAVEAHPLAAATLVQTLRLNEVLAPAAALVAESLAYASLQAGAEFRLWHAGYKRGPAGVAGTGPAVEIRRKREQLQLTLNRPATRNAMTIEMRDALVEALCLCLADPGLTDIRIDARGACFSTGGDLSEFGTAPDPAIAHAVRALALPGRLLLQLKARASVYVHGACIGSGIEFPAFAGRLIAAPDAWFQLPELAYGLIPGAGGTVGIQRRIGRQRTAWLALSGRRIKAPTALDWGLVDAIGASPVGI